MPKLHSPASNFTAILKSEFCCLWIMKTGLRKWNVDDGDIFLKMIKESWISEWILKVLRLGESSLDHLKEYWIFKSAFWKFPVNTEFWEKCFENTQEILPPIRAFWKFSWISEWCGQVSESSLGNFNDDTVILRNKISFKKLSSLFAWLARSSVWPSCPF